MRLLIIRFSSFGDIFQALEVVAHVKRCAPQAEIDWIVRQDFAALLENQPGITNVLAFDRKRSVWDLVKVAWQIAPRYSHVYDAHSNLRSTIVRIVIRLRWLMIGRFSPSRILIRSKDRLRRWLYFDVRRILGIKFALFPEPFRGAESYVKPLRKWFPELRLEFSQISWVPENRASEIKLEFERWRSQRSASRIIAFAPSAAWPNKRWPVDRWLKLAKMLTAQSLETRFLLLGGPEDSFLLEIQRELGEAVCFSAVGRSSLIESACLLERVDALVANDTGLLHVADRLQKPLVGIIGPTAFGYPSNPRARTAEVLNADLRCKPCSKDGRDRCTNVDNLNCLKSIEPELVANRLLDSLGSRSDRMASQGIT